MHHHIHLFQRFVQLLPFLAIVPVFLAQTCRSAQLVWTNAAGGNWTVAANWNPNTVPAAGDSVVITNEGTFTVTLAAGATLNSLTLGSTLTPGTRTLQLTAGTLAVTNTYSETNGIIFMNGGSMNSTGPFNSAGAVWAANASVWRLFITNATVGVYNLTNGELRGGALTVTNLNWVAGDMNADTNNDRTIIPPGGTLNYVGATTRNMSYRAPASRGRDLDNYGTWNWTGTNSALVGYGAQVVNNYGTVNVTGTGGTGTYVEFVNGNGTIPTWNNYGTLNKTPGSNLLYFASCYLINNGLMNIQSGQLDLYANIATNAAQGNITLGANAQLICEQNATVTLAPDSRLTGAGTNTVRVDAATVYMQTTNISVPSLSLNSASSSVQQLTNNVIPVVNQVAGTWRVYVPVTAGTYNLSGGEYRGATVTVTNLNWTGGSMNADTTNDDRTIIPPGGVLNFAVSSASCTLSFYGPATHGRGLDNYGTWNWSGTNGVLVGATAAVVNNYGAVNVTFTGAPGTYAEFANANGTIPIWNNYGTLTKTPGNNLLYFASTYVNNYGTMDIQTGQLDSYASITTNTATGLISLGVNAQWINEQSEITTLSPGSRVIAQGTNSVLLNAATMYVNSTNLAVNSLLINNASATVLQNTNNVIPVINQNSGVWRLNVATAVDTYNLSGGEFRGANLVVTNFNWTGGQLDSEGLGSNLVTVVSNLNISTAGAKTMSYYVQPGRTLVNNGTGTWAGAIITGQGGAAIINNGTLTQNADTALQWGGSGAQSVFLNNATFTKANGTNASYFAGTFVTNAGTFIIQNGSVRLGTAYVQTAGATVLKTNFLADGTVRIEGGTFTGGGDVTGQFYNNGTASPGASPGLITGTSFTNVAAATLNMELGGTVGGVSYDQIRLTGNAGLSGTLNLSFVNGFTPVLSNAFTVLTFASRSGTFGAITTPPNFGFTPVYTTTNLTLIVTGLTNAPLQIITAPTNVTVWQPDPVTFTAAASGNTPLTYQWKLNGTNIPNATNTVYSLPSTSPTDSGTYSFVVTDSTSVQTNVSATLTVIPFDGTILWTNTGGGDWATAVNWLPQRVPGATNTAVITNAGTYNVTITSAVTVSNIVVGARSTAGNPSLVLSSSTLTLGNRATFETNAVFSVSSTVQTLGSVIEVRGRMDWNGGAITGIGRTIITNTATLSFNSPFTSKVITSNLLENYGTFTYSGDSGFGPGRMLDFAGGSTLTNFPGGSISLGSGNGYAYSGTPPQRSYLVNLGSIFFAGAPNVPGGISVELINYGLLSGGYCYINRGTNYGTINLGNTLSDLGFFGNETTGEYFSFEPGTAFTGAAGKISIVGPVRWNAPNCVQNFVLGIGGASGGASSPNAHFLAVANLTNAVTVSVGRGAMTVTNNCVASLNTLSDSIVNNWDYTINNYGTMYANTVSHNGRTFNNAGQLGIRSNLTLTAGVISGGGHITLSNTVSAALAGGGFDAERIDNFGIATVSAASGYIGNAYFENKTNAQLVFSGGNFNTGPGTVANYGTLAGYGGFTAGISVTNFNSVTADDSANRSLALNTYIQQGGVTAGLRGAMTGTLRIFGGVLTGTNTITGSVWNAATIAPGKPYGILTVSGPYTNAAAGIQLMPIGATNLYPQIKVIGTASLAGTLQVSFTNGFYPVTGNTFTSLVFTASSGAFDGVTTPNYDFEKILNPTNFLLRASNALPVMTLLIPAGSNQLVCTPIKAYASGVDPDGAVTNIDILVNASLASTRAGNSVTNLAEADSPMTLTFVARGRDDRNGFGYATQQVTIVNYSLTNVLFMGGVRTNDFKLCMVGEPGRDYEVYGSTNLTTTNWADLGTMIQAGGTWHYVDQWTVTNRPYRFYRTKQLP